MNKLQKRQLTAFVLTIILCLIYVFGANYKGASALASSAQSPPSNVAYFDGYGDSLDSLTIHNKTRLPVYAADAPSITVLVHGQNGSASHWSNEGQDNFVYDSESLIERLRVDSGGANVYWVRMSKDKNEISENNFGYDDNFWIINEGKKKEYVPYMPNRFFLTRLEVGHYNTDNEHGETQQFVTAIDV